MQELKSCVRVDLTVKLYTLGQKVGLVLACIKPLQLWIGKWRIPNGWNTLLEVLKAKSKAVFRMHKCLKLQVVKK